MEYVKKCLQLCCKRCIDDRKGSDVSTKIILPPTRRGSSVPGSGIPLTYTYLAQPPNNRDSNSNFCGSNLTLQVPSMVRRKLSSPSVLTSTVPIQLRNSYSSLLDSTHSMPDPTIRVEEADDSWNNNYSCGAGDVLWRCDSVPTVHNANAKMLPMKRLSLAQTYSSHSRRSSMSSFDISKDEVDSDLYDSSEIIPDINSNGRLCFTVNYDREFEQLSVCVVSAKSLWYHETSSSVTDSFVKVSLLPPFKKKTTKSTTATQRATQNPVYNETFTFDRITFGLHSTIHIKLTVCTFDKSSRKKKLGTIIYKLDQETAQKQSEQKVWRHLYAPGTTQQVTRILWKVSPEQFECGRLTLSYYQCDVCCCYLSYDRTVFVYRCYLPHDDHGYDCLLQASTDKGNLMLTTTYHPNQGHLHVNVVKASELDVSQQEKALDGVYVKVALVQNGKVISKNKTKLVQPMSSGPAFDETFVFNLPSNMIDQSCLLVAVCGKTTSGKRIHLGYVSLGPPFFATGSGLEQWTKMISMPYSAVGKWHPLGVWTKKDSSHHLANECNMF